jgi:GNAT superfamily N-acetyltransferase
MTTSEFEIREESPAQLGEYAQVPISFTVSSRLMVEPIDRGLGGYRFTEQPVEPPWVKDYDELDSPARWLERRLLDNWGFLAAFDNRGERIGGAVIGWDTPDLYMLRERRDLAALWDLRVRPDYRGRGVGTQLFARVEEWARERGCTLLSVETQDINVRACRFYAARGCVLGTIDRHAYADAPDETQLIWFKSLNE